MQVLRGEVLDGVHFLLWLFLFGGTEADIVTGDDRGLELALDCVVLDEVAEHIEIGGFLGTGLQIFQKEQLALPHLIFFVVLFLRMPFGDLLKLLLDLIDLGDIDKGDVLLPVDALELEAFVDGARVHEVYLLLDDWELQGLLVLDVLYHYYYSRERWKLY